MKNKNETDEIDDVSDDENISEQNTDHDLPSGVYHRCVMSDGSRSIDICTPAGHIALPDFVDLAMYMMVFIQNEDMRKKMKHEYFKFYNKIEKKPMEVRI